MSSEGNRDKDLRLVSLRTEVGIAIQNVIHQPVGVTDLGRNAQRGAKFYAGRKDDPGDILVLHLED